MDAFDSDSLDRFRRSDEVRIETTRGPGASVHRTIIWVVVDDAGRVLIRSVRGAVARWYREARANPECAIWVGDERIAVRVEPATDPDRVAAYTQALQAKYRPGMSVQAMIRDEVLDTTLELHRVDSPAPVD